MVPVVTDTERGVLAPKGYEDTPDGSWFGSFKVENDEVWENRHAFKGFSVEGLFGMKNAYAALDRWAEAHGVQPVPEIKACELQMQDGSVMVVVETQHDAEMYQQFRPDVLNRHIWTMQELEVIMESPVIKETMKIKALHPTANLVRLDKDPVKFPNAGETGLDDMKSDELEGEPMKKVFDTSKMVRKASNRALEAF